MDGAVAFVGLYATLAELAAVGINRVGALTARRWSGATGDGMPWAHAGSLALHRVVAAVATAAAVSLAVVMAVIHHSGPDLGVLALPVVLGLTMLGRTAAHIGIALRGE